MSQMSIGAAIGWLADQDPDRPAVTCGGQTVSRRELDLRTNRLARAYQEMGVQPDDRVTIALPNGIEFVESAVAIWKLGATPQPVSRYLTDPEIEAIVELAASRLVIGRSGPKGVPEGFEPPADMSDAPLPDRVATSWKAATSGGSTGRPKLIVAGARGVTDPTKSIYHRTDLRVGDVQLVPGPLYHNAPFSYSFQGLFLGGHLVIQAKFDASEALQLLERHRVQWMQLVPTTMLRIWRLPEAERVAADLRALRVVLHTAAPCPAWLKEAWIDWLGPGRIAELYGGAEGQGMAVIWGDEWLQHRGSVGRPTGCQMRILDSETHQELPYGEVGEVWIKSEQPRANRYRYVGAEAKVLDGEWDSLGDLGSMDADGYLYLADRRADLIISGGANIYPAEVEAALIEHPQVSSCVVVGKPDEDWGQRVHAYVQLADPSLTDDELRAFLGERLVRYKIPRTFERVEEALRDEAGKVRRSHWRDLVGQEG